MDAVPWLLRCVASSSAVRRRTIPASTLASEAFVGTTSGGIWAVRVARSWFTCNTSKGAIALTPFHGDIRKEAPKGKLSMRDAERKQPLTSAPMAFAIERADVDRRTVRPSIAQ